MYYFETIIEDYILYRCTRLHKSKLYIFIYQ